jgi:hypothetical protein
MVFIFLLLAYHECIDSNRIIAILPMDLNLTAEALERHNVSSSTRCQLSAKVTIKVGVRRTRIEDLVIYAQD